MHSKISVEFTVIPKEDGDIQPLLLHICINNKRKLISTGLQVSLKLWDKKNGKIKTGRKDEYLNSYMHDATTRVISIYHDMISSNSYGWKKFNKDLFIIKSHALPLKQIIELYKDTLLCESTIYGYVYLKSKIEAFAKKQGIVNIPLISINKKFAEDFHLFLMKDHKLDSVTVNGIFSKLQCCINHAVKKELISHNPIKGFSIKTVRKNRDSLSLKEVKHISKQHIQTPEIKYAKYLFLLQCYTGIRYQELRAIQNSQFQYDSAGFLWLVIKRNAKLTSRIPMVKQSIRILNKAKKAITEAGYYKKSSLLPTYRIDTYNKYLKQLSTYSGMRYPITSLSARTTFIKSIALSQGVSIESLSNMLGHSDIFYTKRTCNYSDIKIIQEMSPTLKFFGYEA